MKNYKTWVIKFLSIALTRLRLSPSRRSFIMDPGKEAQQLKTPSRSRVWAPKRTLSQMYSPTKVITATSCKTIKQNNFRKWTKNPW